MATITSTPTGGTLTANKNKEVKGTISWSKPTVPSGATISSCVLTGKATASMSKGSVTITVNGTTVTSGSNFTINLGTDNSTTSVTTSIKGGNNQASGSVSFSELLYTVTYEEVKSTYTVTFVDWNGTVLKTQTVEEGSSATAPSNPSRDGYNFTGWDKDFSNVTANVTITAQYEKVVYDIMVAEYKFDNTIYDLFPEFNEGSAYTYEDIVEGNVTTRTIYSDSLPTLIRFGDIKGDDAKANSLLEVLYLDTSNIIDMSYMFDGCSNLTKIYDTYTVSHIDIDLPISNMVTFIAHEEFEWVTPEYINDKNPETKMSVTVPTTDSITDYGTKAYFNIDSKKIPYNATITKATLNCTFSRSFNLLAESYCRIYVNETDYIYEIALSKQGNQHTITVDLTDYVNNLLNGEVFIATSAPTSIEYGFYIYEAAFTIDYDEEFITFSDTSNVTDMEGMFYNCFKLNNLNVSNWDVSNVTNMNNMFKDCYKLTSLDLSNWDTSSATTMAGMFSACTNLVTVDTTNWNTSSVTNMAHMFGRESTGDTHLGCENLEKVIGIEDWNVDNVKDMSQMFYGAWMLETLDLSKWDTSNVTNMAVMFCGAGADNPNFSLNIKDWDVSKVLYMEYMFDCCYPLKELDLSDWNIGNVLSMFWMFGNDDANDSMMLTKLNLSGWKFNNNVNMNNFFSYTDKINEVIMNDSDYNSVNKVIAQLPTRTNDSMGTLNIIGIDDISQVDITTAESKLWNIINEEEPEGAIPVEKTVALRPISATQDSGYNNTWTNIANTYDTDTSTSGTIVVTGSSQSGFKRKYVDTIFNFDNPIPSNAIINSAVLTVRAKQSATTNLNMTVSIGSQEVISSTLLSSSSTNYTADVANYIKDLNQLNINLTSAATSNRTFTLYDVRVDVNYTVYEEIPEEPEVPENPIVYYTVTFKDYDGTVLSTQTIEEGYDAIAPADPTRDGYIFKGWSKSFTNVSSNLEVIALYESVIVPDEPEEPSTSSITNIKIGDTVLQNLYIGGLPITKIYIGDYILYEAEKKHSPAASIAPTKIEFDVETEVEFEGDGDYIDTKVDLFDDGNDWSFLIDFTDEGKAEWSDSLFILHNFFEGPDGELQGLNIQKTGEAQGTRLSFQVNDNFYATKQLSNGVNTRLVFTFKYPGELHMYYNDPDIDAYLGSNGHYKFAFNEYFDLDKCNLHLACWYNESQGGVGRFWRGIINEFIIWNKTALSDEQVQYILQNKAKN